MDASARPPAGPAGRRVAGRQLRLQVAFDGHAYLMATKAQFGLLVALHRGRHMAAQRRQRCTLDGQQRQQAQVGEATRQRPSRMAATSPHTGSPSPACGPPRRCARHPTRPPTHAVRRVRSTSHPGCRRRAGEAGLAGSCAQIAFAAPVLPASSGIAPAVGSELVDRRLASPPANCAAWTHLRRARCCLNVARRSDRHQQRDDRHHDDQLDEGEATPSQWTHQPPHHQSLQPRAVERAGCSLREMHVEHVRRRRAGASGRAVAAAHVGPRSLPPAATGSAKGSRGRRRRKYRRRAPSPAAAAALADVDQLGTPVHQRLQAWRG